MIRNSYDRLSANKQVLTQQVSEPSQRGTNFKRNNDLLDVAKEDLRELDRQIEFEQEIARQLPFRQRGDSGDDNSPPRMQSP